MKQFPPARARRLAVAAQGLHRERPSGRVDLRHLRRTFADVALLQIDSVNVLARAHRLTLFARLGPYDPTLIARAYRARELFEYWGHVASLLPIDDWPLFRHRMEAVEPGPRTRKLMGEEPGYIERVLEEVASRGRVTAADLEDPGDRTGPWWGWGKGKVALEWLFATGRITVSDRRNFTRIYDLPERVIPEDVLRRRAPDAAEATRNLTMKAVRALGIGTAADIADYYRLRTAAVRNVLAGLVGEGSVSSVRVEGWREEAFLDPEATVPRRSAPPRLLCPFDSLVWHRERVERLFGFHYRIEIYVPAPRRQYGYYVLPFLLGDRLVARVDLKADRKGGVLLVPGAFVEAGREPSAVSGPLADELRAMAGWLGLDRISIGSRGNLARRLRTAVGGVASGRREGS